ncbi:unnamed protein product [Moneuplotes crassus]|uniref:C2H2-type domain-containing protein n=1 Tax=Euplotes crassus TaxID=5936 RepID=A0AAD1U025_EUPCR|nr:unnamed protein product [Moneuplotes crassus]
MKAISISKQFVCSHPDCDKEYSTKFALKRHMIIHAGTKKFACRFCSKKFSLEQYKKEHEYIHTNETPYVCGIDGCTQAFRQRAKLCLHRAGHKGYKKKSYKVYSRKNKGGKSTKAQKRQAVVAPEVRYSTHSFGLNECQMVGQVTQDMANSAQYEYNMSLLMTLSTNYCLCEIYTGSQGTYPIGFYDQSITQPEVQYTMERARQGLSTLQTPKGSFYKPEDQMTPTTMMESAATFNMLDNRSWQDFSQRI